MNAPGGSLVARGDGGVALAMPSAPLYDQGHRQLALMQNYAESRVRSVFAEYPLLQPVAVIAVVLFLAWVTRRLVAVVFPPARASPSRWRSA